MVIARVSEKEIRLYRGRRMARRRVECPVCGAAEDIRPTRRGEIVKFTCEECGAAQVVEIE